MPPATAHGLNRGPFFVVDPSHRRRVSAYYPRVVCVQDMEAVHTGQHPRQAYPHTVLARLTAFYAQFLRQWHYLHRQRFYVRFCGIVAPHTGIPNAASERGYSRSNRQNARDRAKTLQPENDRSPASLRHSQKPGTGKPYSARESREGLGARADFPPLVAAKVVTTL